MIADEVVEAVVTMATANPWYGYKRIAVPPRGKQREESRGVRGDAGPRLIAEAQDVPRRGLPGGQAVRAVAARPQRPVAEHHRLYNPRSTD
jgi:hypothetical protein